MTHSLIDHIERNFPSDLLQLSQWVLWRKVTRNGKPTKAPYTLDGFGAQSNNPATWASFEECARVFSRGNYSGVGFMFSEHDPYVGVDFDHCAEGGHVAPHVAQQIAQMHSYAEFSQSATGIHVIGKATLPGNGRKRNNIEIYDRLRFFVVTGDKLPGAPTTAENIQAAVDELYAQLAPKEVAQICTTSSCIGLLADDQQLLDRMFTSRNGAKVQALFDGDMSGYSSQSEAELALCGHLAFWTGNDESRIDQLFRQSALYRDKWERQARAGETYGQGTIKRALKAEVYTGKRQILVHVTVMVGGAA